MQMVFRPRTDYMLSVQDNMRPSTRTVVVDWLIEVADDFRMVTETLYLTVSYFDRCGLLGEDLVQECCVGRFWLTN